MIRVLIKWMADHFSKGLGQPLRALLRTTYLRGWRLRVVTLLEQGWSLEAAASFSNMFSKMFLAIMGMQPVQDALDQQDRDRLYNAWAAS
jgi:hypothetical protein